MTRQSSIGASGNGPGCIMDDILPWQINSGYNLYEAGRIVGFGKNKLNT